MLARVARLGYVSCVGARRVNTISGSGIVSLGTEEKVEIPVSTVADHKDVNRLTQLTGFKEIEQSRKVQIHIPAKNVMQSGTFGNNKWRLRWDTQERFENPLMGWASSSDPLSNMQLSFSSSQDAINYCVKHGLEYEVIEPKRASKKVKSYGDNFSWSSRKRVVAK